jgi:hypothetical protein
VDSPSVISLDVYSDSFTKVMVTLVGFTIRSAGTSTISRKVSAPGPDRARGEKPMRRSSADSGALYWYRNEERVPDLISGLIMYIRCHSGMKGECRRGISKFHLGSEAAANHPYPVTQLLTRSGPIPFRGRRNGEGISPRESQEFT